MILFYLKVALFFGFVDHVYNLSDRWGRNSNNERRYNAACMIGAKLLERGFHECPSCFWPTKTRNEHLADQSGFCYAESERRRQDWIDAEYADPNSFDGMPDRAVHNAFKA